MRYHAAPRLVGNLIVGVVEQAEIYAYFSQHLGRVCAQFPKDFRNTDGGPYTQYGFRSIFPLLLPSRDLLFPLWNSLIYF